MKQTTSFIFRKGRYMIKRLQNWERKNILFFCNDDAFWGEQITLVKLLYDGEKNVKPFLILRHDVGGTNDKQLCDKTHIANSFIYLTFYSSYSTKIKTLTCNVIWKG